MHRLIAKYWRGWFPRLPSYQTFVRRLNRLEPTFQTFGARLSDALAAKSVPELDHLVDSLPVMLARHGHSYRAYRARDGRHRLLRGEEDPLPRRAPALRRTKAGGAFTAACLNLAVLGLALRLESLHRAATGDTLD
jgi:hypothetical protein